MMFFSVGSKGSTSGASSNSSSTDAAILSVYNVTLTSNVIAQVGRPDSQWGRNLWWGRGEVESGPLSDQVVLNVAFPVF